MSGFLALAHVWIFASRLGASLEVNSAEFRFMMQIAMVCGFLTAYPVNIWPINRGVEEAMSGCRRSPGFRLWKRPAGCAAPRHPPLPS
ncbi:DUF4396 domain-containing protein [Aurantimonas sp. 22II-16-19i]|uniref:DUF4396 domain-containing protein n=1 Tax=Aurantimonas sp. 22II-16-19i TaxID=1317114 RepID=UPI0009F7F663|nr:DUF4396 domain-containing protein [Aurantimonas sp. 22II-16-19i]ORE98135.1 hypothetical protein ATO4_06059 [Aurantimonas sp. 22II-16-19i]